MVNQTFILCKSVTIKQKAKGTLDITEMTSKIDVLLLNDRLTPDEYNELVALMKAE